MSRVRPKGNLKTELVLVKLFRQHRITGWRRHLKIFGNPDFVFRELRLAIFVDGCFWHGCSKHASYPVTNHAFWKKKLLSNKERDRLVTRTLKKRGWHVLRIWQHSLTSRHRSRCIFRVRQAMQLKKVPGESFLPTPAAPGSKFARMYLVASGSSQPAGTYEAHCSRH